MLARRRHLDPVPRVLPRLPLRRWARCASRARAPSGPLYFAILLSHTVLAVAIVPLVLVTATRALRGRFDAHRAARARSPCPCGSGCRCPASSCTGCCTGCRAQAPRLRAPRMRLGSDALTRNWPSRLVDRAEPQGHSGQFFDGPACGLADDLRILSLRDTRLGQRCRLGVAATTARARRQHGRRAASSHPSPPARAPRIPARPAGCDAASSRKRRISPGPAESASSTTSSAFGGRS